MTKKTFNGVLIERSAVAKSLVEVSDAGRSNTEQAAELSPWNLHLCATCPALKCWGGEGRRDVIKSLAVVDQLVCVSCCAGIEECAGP